MAQKRMFDKRITDSDKFTDLPNSSKALYFMAGMAADDRGFFQPRRLQKICGFTDDDFKVLIAKRYFIPFESGVMVITDWNKNNWLDKRRINETEYIDELKLLDLINEKYELKDDCLANAKPMLREYSIEENRINNNNAQKNEIFEQRFEIFYKEYPRKVNKKETLKWFIKHKPNEELFNLIMTNLKEQKKFWKEKKYIPYPTSWLNGEKWNDELEEQNDDDEVKLTKIGDGAFIIGG